MAASTRSDLREPLVFIDFPLARQRAGRANRVVNIREGW